MRLNKERRIFLIVISISMDSIKGTIGVNRRAIHRVNVRNKP